MYTFRDDLIKFAYDNPGEVQDVLLTVLAGESVEEKLKSMTFKHPGSGNKVKFKSLPAEEQKRIREKAKGKRKKEPSNFGVVLGKLCPKSECKDVHNGQSI